MSFREHLSKYTPKRIQRCEGDFYVAPNGNDANDGSLRKPFATLQRAAEAVRELKKTKKGGITVSIHGGEYLTECFHLTAEDSGTADCPITYCAYGDGEVIINGGVTLHAMDFDPVSDDVRERLDPEARDHVVQVDLKKYGLTKADWGHLCPIGKYITADKYDDYIPDVNCELFVNGSRMTLARYPNKGFARLNGVAEIGDVWEYPEQNYYYDWKERRNHYGGKYMMSKGMNLRAKKWKSLEDIWVYGYFYHDWADASTPIERFELDHRTFYPKYVARYGAKKDALYYFYNILEELDVPGEWYLDREEGMLYFYPPEDVPDLNAARVEMTISRDNIIRAENVNYITFQGLTLKGTRSDALHITGNNNTMRRLTVFGVMGNAIMVNGYRNLISECHICHTGKGGVFVEGGDFETLTPGENVVDNNLIHNFAEVYLTYYPAVQLDGVGNICSHNEIYNAPHAAILYYGNDHIIEYNHIHDVVLLSSDAGAIYSGQSWTRYGCVIRYNCLYNIGSEGFNPDGIYFDDMLSGQETYGNLIVGVRKNAILIGGGRDIKVYNNIMIRNGRSIFYDDRGRDGYKNNGWAASSVNNYETSNMWVRLRRVPYQSEIWAKKYPRLAALSSDFSNPDSLDFPPNPAYSEVYNNLIIDEKKIGVRAFGDVPVMSSIHDNAVFDDELDAGFIEGTYTLMPSAKAFLEMPGFKNLPINKMGRY